MSETQTMASPPGIVVTNYQRMGQLVKTWATGVNHIGDKNTYPVPSTITELVQQCEYAGVGLKLPPIYTELQVATESPSKLVLRLPAKEMIDQAEGELGSSGYYQLPLFYSQMAFGGAKESVRDYLSFHDCRIGDYTISNCR